MKGSTSYIRFMLAIILIALVGFVVVSSQKAEPLSWEPTWSEKQDDPFGTRILRDMAEQMWAPADLEVVRQSPAEFLHDAPLHRPGEVAYFFVNDVFDPEPEEWKSLKRFVKKGNTLWISASFMAGFVQDDLGIKIGELHPSELRAGLQEDSVDCYFNLEGWPDDSYLIPERYLYGIAPQDALTDSSETILATFGGTPVGTNVIIGRGHVVFIACPKLMTNYGALSPEYTSLVSGAISLIPETTKTIYWDEWIKVGNRRRDRDRDQSDSPSALSYIWQHGALRAALLLAITGILLYVIFQSKRIQRMIPPEEPLTNTTLEFTQTIGRLYFQRQNHQQLAKKRIAAFRDHMSDQYLLSEPWGSDEYARQLAAKSGQDPDMILALIRQMRKAETSNQLSEADLQHLSRQIDECILYPESNDP